MPGVEVGLDPGSKHTGIAVFTDDEGTRTGLVAVQLDHRGGRIRDTMAARAGYRRRRRSANLRYRAPRFRNRVRPRGWLAPSLRHRVDTTLSWVDRLTRWAPVRAVHVERAAFDTHAMSAGRPLQGAEYQQGTLAGYEVREFLLARWGRACAYCGATGVPLNIDHIRPRSRGGPDRLSNLVVACVGCNQAKSSMPVEVFLAGRPKVLARVLAQAKAPLRDAAAVNATRWALWRALTGSPPATWSTPSFQQARRPAPGPDGSQSAPAAASTSPPQPEPSRASDTDTSDCCSAATATPTPPEENPMRPADRFDGASPTPAPLRRSPSPLRPEGRSIHRGIR